MTLPQTKRLSKLRVQLKRFSFFFSPHLVCQTIIYAWHVKDPQKTLSSSPNANSRSTDSLRPVRRPVLLVGLWEGANTANFLISWCQLLCPTRRQSPHHTRPSPALMAVQTPPQGYFPLGKSFRGQRLAPAFTGTGNPKVTSTRPSGSESSSAHNSTQTKLVSPVR